MLFFSLLLSFAAVTSVRASPLRHDGFDSNFDYIEIKQLLNSYPLALDGKNTTGLETIFTANAVLTFVTKPPTVVNGSTAIAAYILNTFHSLPTQHALSTQVITATSKNSASAVTYFTATVFGENQYAGQVVTSYGTYRDVLSKTSSGWKVNLRALSFAGPTQAVGTTAILGG
ncbi:hypothetical protein MMC09_003404 [Bachmanniomyces sp. S44760]|nr:hypothetical protein [Bachmanniomyces sp. S44760]